MTDQTETREGNLFTTSSKSLSLHKSSQKNHTVTPNKIIREAAFAERLKVACDDNPNCPPLQFGRLTWIKQQFKIKFNVVASTQSIHRWYVGEVRPRAQTLKMLAEILDREEAWLSSGHDRNRERERDRRNAMATGGVNVVAGLIALDGGHLSFPQEGDRSAFGADLYAIIKGAHYKFKVVAPKTGDDGLTFDIPLNYADLFLIGLVRKDHFSFDLIELDADTIEKHKSMKAGATTLKVEKNGQSYTTRGDRLKLITSFAERP